MEIYETLDNHYNIRQFLGAGNYAKVYLVTNINDNNEYAAKIRKDENNFQHELQMTTVASGLNNPNIIHLNGHGVGSINKNGKITNNVNYLIFEYCPNGDLSIYSK